MENQKMEAGRKAETIEAIDSKLPMPNDNQKPATKRAPKLGLIGRTNSAVKNGKTIFASQNVSLDIPRKSYLKCWFFNQEKSRVSRPAFNFNMHKELPKASISTTYLRLKTTKVDISQLFHCFNISSHTFIINSLKTLPSWFLRTILLRSEDTGTWLILFYEVL